MNEERNASKEGVMEGKMGSFSFFFYFSFEVFRIWERCNLASLRNNENRKSFWKVISISSETGQGQSWNPCVRLALMSYIRDNSKLWVAEYLLTTQLAMFQSTTHCHVTATGRKPRLYEDQSLYTLSVIRSLEECCLRFFLFLFLRWSPS